MAGLLTEATKETFRDLVAEGTVLVDVWGPECQPCLALLPYVEKLDAERQDLSVIALEAPTARRLCMELRVMGLPAFLLFRDGQEVARLAGNDITPASLVGWLDGAVAAPAKG
ncbi:MAG: thioredoxin family protein [Acidimicrobiales bacterium]